MYTSEYYLDRGNKTLFWDVYIRVLPEPWLCFGNKTLFWDVYIRVLPEPW